MQVVLVFDLGGGTLDVSLLEVGNGTIEVLSTGVCWTAWSATENLLHQKRLSMYRCAAPPGTSKCQWWTPIQKDFGLQMG